MTTAGHDDMQFRCHQLESALQHAQVRNQLQQLASKLQTAAEVVGGQWQQLLEVAFFSLIALSWNLFYLMDFSLAKKECQIAVCHCQTAREKWLPWHFIFNWQISIPVQPCQMGVNWSRAGGAKLSIFGMQSSCGPLQYMIAKTFEGLLVPELWTQALFCSNSCVERTLLPRMHLLLCSRPSSNSTCAVTSGTRHLDPPAVSCLWTAAGCWQAQLRIY